VGEPISADGMTHAVNTKGTIAVPKTRHSYMINCLDPINVNGFNKDKSVGSLYLQVSVL